MAPFKSKTTPALQQSNPTTRPLWTATSALYSSPERVFTISAPSKRQSTSVSQRAADISSSSKSIRTDYIKQQHKLVVKGILILEEPDLLEYTGNHPI